MVHPNGQPGEHGVVITPRASGVVVLDGDDVVLARPSPLRHRPHGAGDRQRRRRPGEETPQAAAERELREELGIEAARWDELGIVYEIPSIVQEAVSLFLARDVSAVASDPEDVETIAASACRSAAALRAAGRGEIADAVTARRAVARRRNSSRTRRA